jgi:iron(III) transport system permease protein
VTRSPFGWIAGGVAVSVVAPMAALLWVALQPTGADALAHLLSTVLPRYTLTSLLLVAQVAVCVTLLGVGAGWLVAAYEFPGRRALEIALILPLAMPAFVLAYA